MEMISRKSKYSSLNAHVGKPKRGRKRKIQQVNNGGVEPVNNELQVEINEHRPKRRLKPPARFNDYYVKPVLKISHQPKNVAKISSKPQVIENSRTIPNKKKNEVIENSHTITNKKKNELGAKERYSSVRLGNKRKPSKSLYNDKRNLLSWMISSKVINEGSKVQYAKNRGQSHFFEGVITMDGLIRCSGCYEPMGISRFLNHVGGMSGSFENLFLDSGKSFINLLESSWKRIASRVKSNLIKLEMHENDNLCGICANEGELVCCDGCPSSFHKKCLGIKKLPVGDWHCIYCLCKFCGALEAPKLRDAVVNSERVPCSLCDEKFHKSCRKGTNAVNTEASGLSFCGTKCHEIYNKLQMIVGVKIQLKDGFSCTLLKCFDLPKDLVTNKSLKIQCNSKLAIAFKVMDECFKPIYHDERSRRNMIKDMIYNCKSNYKRMDFSGFFTAILERDDEIISVASIRFHGNKLAEMPFFGTRYLYRGQRMARRLLESIESILFTVGVKELVICAIPNVLKMWQDGFGFKPLEESMRRAMKPMGLVMFPGKPMLQKRIPPTKNKDLRALISR